MAVIVATGIPVTPVAGQDYAHDALFGSQPVGTALEMRSELPWNDGFTAPTTAESVAGPESDFSGVACIEEDGSVSLHANHEERAAMQSDECPEWVALDDFQEVDYGGGIGITMCKVTEGYTVTKGQSLLLSFAAKIKAIFTGKVEGEVWGETMRKRCKYHGCGLDLSLSEANWSANF